MKRTPLKRYTPLKAKRGLNGKSPAKICQLQAEAPIRIALCQRAGGQPKLILHTPVISGKEYQWWQVICIGGKCENCGKSCDALEPHEFKHRSLGGKLSIFNSKMVCRACHETLQNNRPIWSKNNAD